MDELVSIITPCYNGEKYVRHFLDSVLEQTYNNIELIFVDDGSTDNTQKIVEEYKDLFEERGFCLNYIFQENAGQAAAINKGLSIFKGKYLMWIDSDDIMLPNNTKDKVTFLCDNPDCGFVLGKGVFVNSDNIDTTYGCLQRVKPNGNDTLFSDLILVRNVVFGPGVIMARREAILKSIPSLKIFESREGQNWQLMLPLAYHYKCGYLDKFVFKCVVHSDSHSRMKRTIEQTINRYNNFVVLLSETIKNIPKMPENEKQKWIKLVIEKYEYRKMNIYYSNFRIKEGNKIHKKMKTIENRSFPNDSFITFWIKKILRKVCRR